MRYKNCRLLISILLIGMLTPAYSAESVAVQKLIEQGLYWQSRGAWTQAKDTWDKLLLTDPAQVDAMRGLFYHSLQTGNKLEAEKYLQSLRSEHPGHAYIVQLETALETGQIGQPALEKARELSEQGNREEALKYYQITLGGVKPKGDLALEYYQTLAGTKNGWDAANQGLKGLAIENPDNLRYQLAYYRNMTYQERSRREAFGLLEKLADVQSARQGALDAWRAGLLWLNAKRADTKYFEQYLSFRSQDLPISKKLKNIKSARSSSQQKSISNAFTALEDKSLDSALSGFKRVEKNRPNDPDVLAGIGLVYLKKDMFSEAKSYLQRAIKNSPVKRRDWERALSSAAYWTEINTARELRTERKLKDAEVSLRNAIAINKREETGNLLLAEVLKAQKRYPESEQYYKYILALSPNNVVAVRGYSDLLNIQGRFDEALALADSGLSLDTSQGGDVYNEILAQSYLTKARAFINQGEYERGLVAMEEAFSAETGNPWIRLELAQLLRQRGSPERARLLMDDLYDDKRDDTEALHAVAQFEYESGRFLEGLGLLEQIDKLDRTPELMDLQNRLWVQVQIQRAIGFADNDDFQQARRTLVAAENSSASKPELASALAGGWIELGDDKRAISIIRTALRIESDTDLNLQYAGLLLKTRRNDELRLLIARLDATENLNDFQKAELSHIKSSAALRAANDYLEQSDYANAYAALEPELLNDRKNPDIRMMLGRLYVATGDKAEGFVHFNSILSDNPQHLDARRAAIGILMEQGELDKANTMVNEGLEIYPNHPRMYLLAGKVANSQSKNGLARKHFEKALALVGDFDKARISARQMSTTSNGLRMIEAVDIDQKESVSLIDVKKTSNLYSLKSVSGLREDILSDIGRLDAQNSAVLSIGGNLRTRTGDAGLGQMTGLSLPIGFEFALGNAGRVGFRATAESLDAGDLNLANLDAARRFGALALDTSLPGSEIISQSNSGVGISLNYSYKGFSAEVGTTPSDFPVNNAIGNLGWNGQVDRLSLGLEVRRSVVNDSILSYAGAEDRFSGLTWGGVTKTGGKFDVVFDDFSYGTYARVGTYMLEGENVKSNNMTQIGAGVFWRLIQSTENNLTVGLDLASYSYEDNQNFYSLGHGGYFSPKSYLNLGVPITLSGKRGQLSYSVRAFAGFQDFETDAALVFPENPNLQTQLESLAEEDATVRTLYDGNKESGLNYNISSEFEYLVKPQLGIGASLTLQSAANFNEQHLSFFTKYYFKPQYKRNIKVQEGGDLLIPQERW